MSESLLGSKEEGAGRNLTGSFLFIRKKLSPYNEEVNLTTFY